MSFHLSSQLLDVFGHKSNISLVFDFMETDLEVRTFGDDIVNYIRNGTSMFYSEVLRAILPVVFDIPVVTDFQGDMTHNIFSEYRKSTASWLYPKSLAICIATAFPLALLAKYSEQKRMRSEHDSL